ncbi:YiiX/YebB-like N1pC/P60 family cysteine hydrolase [Marinicellulosiphila megalodicopiae]|uniref:YiiX/YebB-like N1pC/P60 family cysteine hydrolase n=1 Tax=Marinicellulosiphila megalodicopiae TaxID=2724896 RepID=UPI003BB16474
MKSGDIIFTQLGEATNAIGSVTKGYKGARVNHVGIVIENQHGKFVLEAFPPEVRLTNINIYLKRSWYGTKNPRYIVGRLKEEYQYLLDKAFTYGLRQRNVPYDHRYLTDESALYCTELIVDMFKYANGGADFFKESPMSFRDIETGEIHDYWKHHYLDFFGMVVPEGEPGSNPGDMSNDERLHIYDVVGDLTGYEP